MSVVSSLVPVCLISPPRSEEVTSSLLRLPLCSPVAVGFQLGSSSSSSSSSPSVFNAPLHRSEASCLYIQLVCWSGDRTCTHTHSLSLSLSLSKWLKEAYTHSLTHPVEVVEGGTHTHTHTHTLSLWCA